MQLGAAAEIEILRTAAAVGIFLGIIYDVFKALRLTVKRYAAVIFCDIAFTLIFGAVYFVFSLSQTDDLRGFVLTGMLAGTAMWCMTLGRLEALALSKTAHLCVSAVTSAVHIALKPLVAFINKIKADMRKIFVNSKPKSEKAKKMPKST